MEPLRIRIDEADLADPRVDAVLARQGSFGMEPPPSKVADRRTALVYRPWFALMLAGALGGLAGWAVIEPFLDDGLRFEGRVEAITPDPMERPLAELKVSGVPVLVRLDLTRLLRDGQPVELEALSGAPRVSVNGTLVREGGRDVILAFEVEGRAGEADAGAVSLTAVRVRDQLLSMLVFPLVAAFVGLFVAAADGLLSRAFRRAALCGLVGLSSGLALGLAAAVAAELVYGMGRGLVDRLEEGDGAPAAAFVAQMVTRGLAWAVAGTAMGLGQGIALRSKRLALNGLLGGVVGALVGGMLFDPISRLLHGEAFGASAHVPRAVGFMVIGLGAGLMIGVVELLARDAWLKMLEGPLAGKEFMLFRNPTTIGSSPKADIYLFKDAEVEPTHAFIHALGEGYELESAAGAGRVLLNGHPLRRRSRLEPGDQIRIGKTVLSFAVKEG